MFKFIQTIKSKLSEIDPIKESIKGTIMKINIFRTNIDDLRLVQDMNQQAVSECVKQTDIYNAKVELLHERFIDYDKKIGNINDKFKKINDNLMKVEDEIADVYESIKLSIKIMNDSLMKQEKEVVKKTESLYKKYIKESDGLDKKVQVLSKDAESYYIKIKDKLNDDSNNFVNKLNKHYYALQKAFNDFVKSKPNANTADLRLSKIENEIEQLSTRISTLFFNGKK